MAKHVDLGRLLALAGLNNDFLYELADCGMRLVAGAGTLRPQRGAEIGNSAAIKLGRVRVQHYWNWAVDATLACSARLRVSNSRAPAKAAPPVDRYAQSH